MARRGLDAERVVDAAVAIADAEGLEAVTLARVASELGVRTPSLYNHVAGREGLLRGIALRGVRELTEALRAAAVGRSGEAAVVAVAHAQRAFAARHPGLYAATQAAPAAGEDEHAAAAAEAVAVLVAVLREWDLGEEEAIHAVRGLRSSVHGFVALEAAGGFGMDVDVEASFDWLVRGLVAALSRRVPARLAPRGILGP